MSHVSCLKSFSTKTPPAVHNCSTMMVLFLLAVMCYAKSQFTKCILESLCHSLEAIPNLTINFTISKGPFVNFPHAKSTGTGLTTSPDLIKCVISVWCIRNPTASAVSWKRSWLAVQQMDLHAANIHGQPGPVTFFNALK